MNERTNEAKKKKTQTSKNEYKYKFCARTAKIIKKKQKSGGCTHSIANEASQMETFCFTNSGQIDCVQTPCK